jgi:hypothetical protein
MMLTLESTLGARSALAANTHPQSPSRGPE